MMFPFEHRTDVVDVNALFALYREETESDFLLSVIFTEEYWVPLAVFDDPDCASYTTAMAWLAAADLVDRRDDFIYRCAAVSYDNDCFQIETFITIQDLALRAHYLLFAERLREPYIKWYTP